MRLEAAENRVVEGGALSFSGGRDCFVVVAAVQDAIAQWAAPLPRTRQPDDAARRAALACACALGELVLGGSAAATWRPAEDGVSEDAATLADRAGLTRAQVEGALTMLAAAGCVERIFGARDQRRVRLRPELCGEVPALARIAWAAVRARLRAVQASVLPALAVLRALARQTGPVPDGAAAPVVACTQEGLAAETLLGRTAVVQALRGLVEAGVVERAARRGTWTECRLLPTAYDAHAGDHPLGVLGDQEVPLGRLAHPLPARASARSLGPAVPSGEAARAPASPPPAPAAPAPLAGGMVLDVGGVRVPVAPGMTVEPPPGATITIEVDAAGRRFVCLGPGLRLGPLA